MSGLISVFVYCFMVAERLSVMSIFLSPAPAISLLPVGLNALFSTPDCYLGTMMAASLVTALPVVIMYALSNILLRGFDRRWREGLKRPVSLQASFT